MSDIITIDTTAGIVKTEDLKPLPLFDDSHPMLNRKIPEYELKLPNENMNSLCKRLKMTMRKFGGIGLAANQCGVFERVFVLGTDQFQFACINPRVIETSESEIKDNEGCLSYPGLYVKVKRPEWVLAEFMNESGEIKQVKFEGVTARCFLHELDHLNGIKFVDHVGPVALQMAKKKQSKLIKVKKAKK